MKHRDNYIQSKQNEQIVSTLTLFNKILGIIEDYEHESKKLHYKDDKKIESFDKIRSTIYDFANGKYGNRSNDRTADGADGADNTEYDG